MDTRYTPPIVFHPGEHLRDWLEENGMTSRELCRRLGGKPEKTISAILNGKSAITPELAESLSLVTGIDSQMWNNLQASYNAYIASQEKLDVYESQWAIWGALFPYSEMVNRGWLPRIPKITKGEKVKQLLTFFGISDHNAYNEVYGELSPQFRLTKGASHDHFATTAWLQQAKLLARRQQPACSYEKDRVLSSLSKLKAILMIPDQSQGQLELTLSQLGITLIILPQLPKASISGVAMWVGDTPTIVLSGKGKSHDRFVFNFWHELGHILLHQGRKGQMFVDEEYGEGNDVEREANDFAMKHLVPEEVLDQCSLSFSDIKTVARIYQVHTSVVLGQLAKKGRIGWPECNTKYKPLTANTILPG